MLESGHASVRFPLVSPNAPMLGNRLRTNYGTDEPKLKGHFGRSSQSRRLFRQRIDVEWRSPSKIKTFALSNPCGRKRLIR